jgi:hypothetical protein
MFLIKLTFSLNFSNCKPTYNTKSEHFPTTAPDILFFAIVYCILPNSNKQHFRASNRTI